MNCQEALQIGRQRLLQLKGHTLDVLDISRPPDIEYAKHLAKVVSKISPLVGNMIEFYSVVELNKEDWRGLGHWERQDPGFPDTIFKGNISPTPGIEIKTWFPLATEITARFKDSSSHFTDENIDVAVVAWLPENIIFGKPKIIDVWIGTAKSLAEARDTHYHNPPDYLVIEPEDTSERTANLQQTNTNGYVFQGTKSQISRAKATVKSWGRRPQQYRTDEGYQKKVRKLLGKYKYRLDTNYAKIDRIEHAELEDFKTRVLASQIHGKTITEWTDKLSEEHTDIEAHIKELLG